MYQKKSYGKCIADKLASCSLTFNGKEGAKICFYRQFVRGKFVKALAPGSSAREWNSADTSYYTMWLLLPNLMVQLVACCPVGVSELIVIWYLTGQI